MLEKLQPILLLKLPQNHLFPCPESSPPSAIAGIGITSEALLVDQHGLCPTPFSPHLPWRGMMSSSHQTPLLQGSRVWEGGREEGRSPVT